MQAYEFEPMSISRILDSTFRIYKQNFIKFITIVAIIQIPIGLLTIVSRSAIQTQVPSRQSIQAIQNGERVEFEEAAQMDADPLKMIIGGIGMIIAGILSMLGSLLCRGALAKSVSEIYLGNEMSVGEAYKHILPKSLSLIGAGLLVSLVTGLGFLLLVVPGVIFALWFALTTPAIVIEDFSATKAMSRSKALAAGNLDKIFSVGFLVLLIAIAINIPFSFIGGILGAMLFAQNATLLLLTTQLVGIIGQIIIVPIGAIAYILLYYDLRIRKEGFDLEMLANNIGSEQGGIDVSQPNLPDSSEI